MKYLLLALSTIVASATASFAQQTSVLFIGNSYVYTENLPAVLYNLALEGGDSIYYESSTPGGYTLEGHSTNATTLSKIASRDWDFVVIQEQSQKPSFSPAQVASETFPYAQILVDSINLNYECTEPVFFMTWGRRDGDQQNCQFYPPLCTFEGMNGRLRESYLQMGLDNDATVAPCGAAWYQMSLVNNTFWSGLYSGDGSHSSAWGGYLNACIFYATILRKSPVGLEYYSNVGATDGPVLQQLAEDIVLDSTSNWFIGHQDVVSDADYSNSGLTAQFTANATNATVHFWDFGDGQTSSLENPANTYGTEGDYTVTHIALSDCGSDTTVLFVEINPLSLESHEINEIELVINENNIVLMNPTETTFQIEMFDLNGRLTFSESLNSSSSINVGNKAPIGMNLIRISNGRVMKTLKVVN